MIVFTLDIQWASHLVQIALGRQIQSHQLTYAFLRTLCVIVLYVHACCIIVIWWDEPGEIESYLDN